jgi:hypothetical protein
MDSSEDLAGTEYLLPVVGNGSGERINEVSSGKPASMV